MAYNYSIQNFDKEHMARAVGVALPVSTKQCIEICNYIRGKPLITARTLLQNAIDLKAAIPFKRFNKDMGHKKGPMAAGRYAVKACTFMMQLFDQVEANAQFKGLDTASLEILHICAQNASRPFHYGRQRRRQSKRCHVEIVVKEAAKKEKRSDEKTKRPAPKQVRKKE